MTNSRAAAANGQPVLDVRDYSLAYGTPAGPVEALRNVSLSIRPGRTLGLVGESGSGKTSLAWAIMRYLPANAVETSGELVLLGEDLRTKSLEEIQDLRGRRVCMVFQDPGASLNPVLRLGDQIAEALVRHRALSQKDARDEGEAWLARTGISRPSEMMNRYPHEASGGEKQRVVIATAFACNPEMIIFDEPTTALDIITARQILDLFDDLHDETGVTALYISHDLGLVSRVAQDVAVINQGAIVEFGPREHVFTRPSHSYTRDLVEAVPNPDHRIVTSEPDAEDALLSLDEVNVMYGRGKNILSFLQPKREVVQGARNVSFGLRAGEILGIVGESGSGKSTIAKTLAGLQDFEGSVAFGPRSYSGRRKIDRAYRRAVQIVFQHPDASLNPRQTIGKILSRPLKLYDLVPRSERSRRVRDLLRSVFLPEDYAERFPHELSGGEKQRVAIARAFAAEPRLVICDEITSSLDVSVQASVARLLVDLQQKTGTACLFITHDLNLVRQLAHRIAVMRNGDLVDLFESSQARAPERHPYTTQLLDAVPVPVEASQVSSAAERAP
ncbi:MAG: ABC transporter ATP-binding protein [Paracoccaceae bacterium]|nr:ABC transporter ATP-binding protein [Paracoccaceae bacterium]